MTDSRHIIGSRQMGGAEKFFARLLPALRDRGHSPCAIVRPSSPLVRELKDIEYMQIGMRNGWDIVSAIKIRRLIQRLSPPIVQTYMGRATRLTKIPSKSSSIHVARLGGYYKIKGYYEHADAWVGNTKRLCDYLVNNGLPADRIYHIGNFVEEKGYPSQVKIREVREKLCIPDEAIVLFSLGRFNHKKGFEDLLNAFKLLTSKQRYDSLYLIVAGDGPLKTRLHSLTQELGLNSRVLWVGWQNDPGLFYSLADIFVCPSRIETMGNVILEAWSYGLPVLATKTPGALELIQDGSNGLLAPIGEPVALAEKLLYLIEAGEKTWWELGTAGLQSLRRDHSKETVVGKYLGMYEELINRKGRYRR